MTPDAALTRLEAGNRRFAEGNRAPPSDEPTLRLALVERQDPFAVVLGCADSRVPPELVYDQGLGDLFTIRVGGNTATDPLVVGTVEFAVASLDVALVVVLGHEQCAAVMTAIDSVTSDVRLDGNLPALVAPITPVVRAAPDRMPDTVIEANVRAGVQHLGANHVVAAAVALGRLRVVGHKLDFTSGRVQSVA